MKARASASALVALTLCSTSLLVGCLGDNEEPEREFQAVINNRSKLDDQTIVREVSSDDLACVQTIVGKVWCWDARDSEASIVELPGVYDDFEVVGREVCSPDSKGVQRGCITPKPAPNRITRTRATFQCAPANFFPPRTLFAPPFAFGALTTSGAWICVPTICPVTLLNPQNVQIDASCFHGRRHAGHAVAAFATESSTSRAIISGSDSSAIAPSDAIAAPGARLSFFASSVASSWPPAAGAGVSAHVGPIARIVIAAANRNLERVDMVLASCRNVIGAAKSEDARGSGVMSTRSGLFSAGRRPRTTSERRRCRGRSGPSR